MRIVFDFMVIPLLCGAPFSLCLPPAMNGLLHRLIRWKGALMFDVATLPEWASRPLEKKNRPLQSKEEEGGIPAGIN